MTTEPLSRARVLAALDPANEALVSAMARHLSRRLWAHDTLPSDVVRELVAMQRAAAGIGPAPGLDGMGLPRAVAGA